MLIESVEILSVYQWLIYKINRRIMYPANTDTLNTSSEHQDAPF